MQNPKSENPGFVQKGPVRVEWTVVSKMTGAVAETGSREVLPWGANARYHVRMTADFLRKVWAPCAYDVRVSEAPSPENRK